MLGSAFIRKLPANGGPERDELLFDAVRMRSIDPCFWVPVYLKHGAYTARIMVMHDTLRVGESGDSFRITCGHDTAQRIADELGLATITAKISDEIFKQATLQLKPMTRFEWVRNGTNKSTKNMLTQSRDLDQVVFDACKKTGWRKCQLYADLGKDWINSLMLWGPPPPVVPGGAVQCDNVPVRSCEYGWHTWSGEYRSVSDAQLKVIQRPSLCHGIGHIDYSQMVRLMQRTVVVSGTTPSGVPFTSEVDVDTVIQSKELAPLLNHEGPLPAMRHPAVVPSCAPGIRCPSKEPRLLPDARPAAMPAAEVMLEVAKILPPLSCGTSCAKIEPVSAKNQQDILQASIVPPQGGAGVKAAALVGGLALGWAIMRAL